jgi:translation initiation factor IF-1
MVKEEAIELEGEVIECGKGGNFRVQCESHLVIAKLSGRMRKNRIRVVLGDRVAVEVSPYDPTRGRITFRRK